MAATVVYKGETAYILGETDSNATAYDNIQVVVYNRERDVLIAAAMATAAGYDTSIFRVSDDKEFEVLLRHTVTASAEPGIYTAEVKLSETDSEWATGVASIYQNVLMFELREAIV
jgi:hypothetical protein